MKKNLLYYLGFLGFMGLLGLFTANAGFYGFFGFFAFFAFCRIRSDERLVENINKATRNVFVTSLIVFISITVLGSVFSSIKIFFYGFIITFVQQIIVFTLSFHYYDKVG